MLVLLCATILFKKYIMCGTPMLIRVANAFVIFCGLGLAHDGEKPYLLVFCDDERASSRQVKNSITL